MVGEQSESREGSRVPFRDPVWISGPGGALDCRGLDLSVAGVGVELAGVAPWPLGASVELQLRLPGLEPLALAGRVVRRFEHLRHLERWRTQGVGIAFDEISHTARDAIARYVAGWLEPELALEEAPPIS